MAPRAPLPTKFAAAEKHMGGFLRFCRCETYTDPRGTQNISDWRPVRRKISKAGVVATVFRVPDPSPPIYDHELSRELHALGYRTRPAGKSFEIDGVAPDVLDRFSKRRRQIDVEAAKFIAREGPPANEKDLRERVAHDKRRRKIKEATAETLRKTWLGQLTAAEQKALESLRIGAVNNPARRSGPQSCSLGQNATFSSAIRCAPSMNCSRLHSSAGGVSRSACRVSVTP